MATIREAFAETPYPGDDILVVAKPGEDPECDQIAENFRGKSWQEVSVDMIGNFADSLPLFTSQAFRYYMPAYMLASLTPAADLDFSNEPASSEHNFCFDNNDIVSFVLFELFPPALPVDDEYFLTRAAQFTLREREAIVTYLNLIAMLKYGECYRDDPGSECDEIARAIRFWEDGEISLP